MAHDLTDRIRDSYEAIPYRSGPHYASHPDCLATVASLRGIRPPDIGRCRVLELGCATGGHLLPMALSLPESEFVGVDLAPGHIATARRTAEAVGLDNARFLAADLRHLPDDLGVFDYVLCHGVYSWVPDDVRRSLLDVVAARLAPGGLATVSFNALPGSQPRDSVRGLFRFALERVLAVGDPVADVRSLLQILPAAFAGVEGAFLEQLRTTAEECRDEPAYYLAHEYLAPVNQAFYLWEVARDAEAAGLRWVSDAWDHDDGEDLPEQARDLLDRLSPTPLDRRQWIDLLRDTAFHRAILCHAHQEPAGEMDAAAVPELHAAAGAWPVAGDRQSRAENLPAASAFASRTHRVSTNVPLVQAALRRLHDAWPAAIPVRTLWDQARRETQSSGADPAAPDDLDFLADALLRCYRHHLVSLHVRPFPVETEPGRTPAASRLARYQTEHGTDVTNLVHQRVRLDDLERMVLRLLDGERDRAAVRAALGSTGPGGDAPSEERVEASIRVLAKASLLHARRPQPS